jgi:hypothetical protein
MDSERVELGQSVHQLPQAASKPVVPIHEHGIELPALGIYK